MLECSETIAGSVDLPESVGWRHTWPAAGTEAPAPWQTPKARSRPESPPARSGTSPVTNDIAEIRTLRHLRWSAFVSPWPCNPVKGEMKSHAECKLRFPCEQFRSRQTHRTNASVSMKAKHCAGALFVCFRPVLLQLGQARNQFSSGCRPAT